MENLLKEVAAKAVVPASPPPETNSTETTVDIQTELRLLVERSDFQNALWKALSEQKKELVLYVCKLITSSGKMPSDLSQPVCIDICSIVYHSKTLLHHYRYSCVWVNKSRAILIRRSI